MNPRSHFHLPNLTFHFFDTVDSTNDTASQLLELGCENGTVIQAITQTRGRGSKQRRWESPTGGVYLSLILKGLPDFPLTQLPIVTSLGIAKALTPYLSPLTPLQIKWPNDCLIRGKKIGGTLIEIKEKGTVIGIGLNVHGNSTQLEETLLNHWGGHGPPPLPPGILSDYSIQAVEVTTLGQEIARSVFHQLTLFFSTGFSSFKNAWNAYGLYVGQMVKIWQTEGSDKKNSILGIFEGIGDEGEALVSPHDPLTSWAPSRPISVVYGDMRCF